MHAHANMSAAAEDYIEIGWLSGVNQMLIQVAIKKSVAAVHYSVVAWLIEESLNQAGFKRNSVHNKADVDMGQPAVSVLESSQVLLHLRKRY